MINNMWKVILIPKVIYKFRLTLQNDGFETAVSYFCFCVLLGLDLFRPTLNRFICCLNIVGMK